jgi:transposase InsO family protein
MSSQPKVLAKAKGHAKSLRKTSSMMIDNPIQQRFLDQQHQISDKLEEVLNLYNKAPETSVIDPFVQWLSEPIPKFYDYQYNPIQLDEAFKANIQQVLMEYRSRRGDIPSQIYDEAEDKRDTCEVTYMHTLWCQRINTIQEKLNQHAIISKSSSTESPPSLEQHAHKKQRIDDSANQFNGQSNVIAPILPFISASELHRMSQSTNPVERNAAISFMNSRPSTNIQISSPPSGILSTNINPTPHPMLVTDLTHSPQRNSQEEMRTWMQGSQTSDYPQISPYHTSTMPTPPLVHHQPEPTQFMYHPSMSTRQLPSAPPPTITKLNFKSVEELGLWYNKMHPALASIPHQWEILGCAMEDKLQTLAISAIKHHLFLKHKISIGTIGGINLQGIPQQTWPVKSFLKILLDIYTYNSKSKYNDTYMLSTNLMALVGTVLPGDAQDAGEMASNLLDLDTKVQLLQLDNTKFIQEIKSWARNLTKSPKYSMDFKAILPKFIDMITDRKNPITGEQEIVSNLSILADRITYFGSWAAERRDEGNPFGEFTGFRSKDTFKKLESKFSPRQSTDSNKADIKEPFKFSSSNKNNNAYNKSPPSDLPPCNTCGFKHNQKNPCGQRNHPNANKSNKPWAESEMGKKWKFLGHNCVQRDKIIKDGKLEPMPAELSAKIQADFPKKGMTDSTDIIANSILTSKPICSKILNFNVYIKGFVGNDSPDIPVTILIDPGSLQANIMIRSLANKLVKTGASISNLKGSIIPGFGDKNRQRDQIDGKIEFVLTFGNLSYSPDLSSRIYTLRATIVEQLDVDLIIGAPSVQYYGLCDILSRHLKQIPLLRDICYEQDEPLPTPTYQHNIIANYLHTYYHQPTDATDYSDHHSVIQLNNLVTNIHISDIFQQEPDDDEIDDTDIAEHFPSSHDIDPTYDCLSDITFKGSPDLQQQLRTICQEYRDIFSRSVKFEPANVTPLSFQYDATQWAKACNKLPPRGMSREKQLALTEMLDELLALDVIEPSIATSWSQVNLVKKPNGKWRLTIDYRNLNKTIQPIGWQIPNISQMLQRIGSSKPEVFGIADLTSGYFQSPLSHECRPATAFITFRGIYQWKRVPQGLLPSGNYFQRIMTEEVLPGVIYHACEAYIDDLLVSGPDETTYLENLRQIFDRLRHKNVTLNPQKVILGASTVEFVGHEINDRGMNMSRKRIENTIQLKKPSNLKELYSFVGICNYFRDHIKNHSVLARPLQQMITIAVQHKSKNITWTSEASDYFLKLKDHINACPILYYVDYTLPIYLCTDASSYAIGGYLYQLQPDGKELPIRFLSKTLAGAQTRWSTIEKEAYAIYYCLTRMEDLLGGVSFTIKTDHKNLLFLNQAGSSKVLNWKLSIQKFDFHIEYIKGVDNIVADTFSRLVDVPDPTPSISITANIVSISKSTDTQRSLIDQYHTSLGAHWGVDRTIQLIRQYEPKTTSKDLWPYLHRDVREFIKACPTCQKMSPIKTIINANRFFLASSLPMMKIDMDTIGPLPTDKNGNKYIVVLIDAFSRYITLSAASDVSAESAAKTFYLHTCRFGFPTSITTDNGTQFMNQLFEQLSKHYGFTHTRSIPYSKEENGIVERANKEVNRHLRNIIFDKNISYEWSDYLPLIERLFNSTIKEPIGVSPNSIIYGNIIDTNTGFIHDIESSNAPIQPISMQSYLDKLIHQQLKLISAAQQSQQAYYLKHNSKQHHKKQHRQYTSKKDNLLHAHHLDEHQQSIQLDPSIYQPATRRSPRLASDITHKQPTSRVHIISNSTRVSQPCAHWILDPTYDTSNIHPDTPGKWIRKSSSNLSSLQFLKDFSNFIQKENQTKHTIGDYVLRKHPTSKAGHGPPNKYGSFWRGPFLVISTDGDNLYTIQNLVTGIINEAHIQQLKPFLYDPKYVNPLTIAAKDNNEFIVERIVDHGMDEDGIPFWRVHWKGYDDSEDTWEPLDNIQQVEQFHTYCKPIPSLHKYLPTNIRKQFKQHKSKTIIPHEDA